MQCWVLRVMPDGLEHMPAHSARAALQYLDLRKRATPKGHEGQAHDHAAKCNPSAPSWILTTILTAPDASWNALRIMPAPLWVKLLWGALQTAAGAGSLSGQRWGTG